jgi:hypothetical protein
MLYREYLLSNFWNNHLNKTICNSLCCLYWPILQQICYFLSNDKGFSEAETFRNFVSPVLFFKYYVLEAVHLKARVFLFLFPIFVTFHIGTFFF